MVCILEQRDPPCPRQQGPQALLTLRRRVQESLVKVLFATETFAMGLNMPARTVLFTTYVKHDGQTSRALTSGEYIQMSGRAGRRGKDDRGYVVMLVEDPDKFSPTVAKQLVSGKPMPLMSRFKLSYYTLLNLSKRREGGMHHMEYLIQHSFQQFQHEQQVPRMRARLEEIEGQLAGPDAPGALVWTHAANVQLASSELACAESLLQFFMAAACTHVHRASANSSHACHTD